MVSPPHPLGESSFLRSWARTVDLHAEACGRCRCHCHCHCHYANAPIESFSGFDTFLILDSDSGLLSNIYLPIQSISTSYSGSYVFPPIYSDAAPPVKIALNVKERHLRDPFAVFVRIQITSFQNPWGQVDSAAWACSSPNFPSPEVSFASLAAGVQCQSFRAKSQAT